MWNNRTQATCTCSLRIYKMDAVWGTVTTFGSNKHELEVKC